ncbi:MAG: 4-alpha-glucanotransferase [Planctomycetota bacterium]
MLKKRASGILLHITSLPASTRRLRRGGPAKYGIGDLGPQAHRFVDFLAKSKQHFWQVLSLNHTTPQKGYSPYNCSSAFAGNPLLISPEQLYREGLLKKEELRDMPAFSRDRVKYNKVAAYKNRLFATAFGRFQNRLKSGNYAAFKAENSSWLDDFTTFVSLQRRFGGRKWNAWPTQLRDRKKEDLKAIRRQLSEEIEFECFLQFVFFEQWFALKRYCNRAEIRIIGDIPIYVTYNSPDVWANPQIFKLGRNKRPEYIAGVPPDYFSRTGQLWGNPVYNWKSLKKTKYRWWMQRIKHNLKIFDFARIDHFRGLIAYWQIPAHHKSAKNGKWVKGPKDDFFKVLLKNFPEAPFIAEDLGHITKDVRDLIKKFDIPTMKVLQFAFSGNPSKNTHLPNNYNENCIVYTGTHDNNTTRGWFKKEASKQQKKRLREYLGQNVTADNVSWLLIQLAMSSVARLAIIPAQDLLALPASARMNNPAKEKGNWLWRLPPGQLSPAVSKKLKQLTQTCARD